MIGYIPADPSFCVPGYIKAQLPAHDELRFKYRPMLAEERGKVNAALPRGPEEYYPVAAEEIARFLKSWSLKTDKGKDVPVSADSIRRVEPLLLERLINIVVGWGVSDIDPQWPEELKRATAGLASESGATRTPPADIMEEADLKNSGAASS